MRAIEAAELVVISGGGLEDFLDDAIGGKAVIDASHGMQLHGGHAHEGHSHVNDPHIWLSPEEAKHMVQNIAEQLADYYPQYADTFHKNEAVLLEKLDALHTYAAEQFQDLSCRELITFHDGFTYLAVTPAGAEEDAELEVSILKSVEEDGEPILCAIEDDQELETVYSMIMDQLFEEEED